MTDWNTEHASLCAWALELDPTQQKQLLDAIEHDSPTVHAYLKNALIQPDHADLGLPNLQDLRNALVLTGESSGHYEFHELIGEGATSQVYRATNNRIRRQVAIKVFLPGLDHFKQIIDEEIDHISDLYHPNMTTILDRGEIHGRPFIVKELGYPIYTHRASQLHRHQTAFALVQQIPDALAWLHNHYEAVHRDLKPSNILSAPGNRFHYWITDFGLMSPLVNNGTRIVSRSRHPSGTPGYLSPEVIRGDRATPASDFYALSVILWELLSGHRMYADVINRQDATSTNLLLELHLTGEIPELPFDIDHPGLTFNRTHARAYVKDCRQLFAEALHKNPMQRLTDPEKYKGRFTYIIGYTYYYHQLRSLRLSRFHRWLAHPNVHWEHSFLQHDPQTVSFNLL